MFGDSYGRGMAQGEDRLIGANFSKLPCLSARMGEFDDLIEIQIASLQTKGYNSIIIYGYELHRRFFESKNYEPKWRTNKTDITGLKNIDVFFKETPVIRAPINPNSVVILDPAEFGDLIQYKVDEEKSDFPLLFSVKEISKNQAKEYLAKYPDLSKHPETGIELSEEDAVRRLQQDIELTLWQRFNIENINTEADIVIIFSEDKIEEEKSAKI